jgi:hypothetical protein
VARPLGKGHLEAQEAGGDLYIRGGNPGIGGDYPNDTKEGHVLVNCMVEIKAGQECRFGHLTTVYMDSTGYPVSTQRHLTFG